MAFGASMLQFKQVRKRTCGMPAPGQCDNMSKAKKLAKPKQRGAMKKIALCGEPLQAWTESPYELLCGYAVCGGCASALESGTEPDVEAGLETLYKEVVAMRDKSFPCFGHRCWQSRRASTPPTTPCGSCSDSDTAMVLVDGKGLYKEELLVEISKQQLVSWEKRRRVFGDVEAASRTKELLEFLSLSSSAEFACEEALLRVEDSPTPDNLLTQADVRRRLGLSSSSASPPRPAEDKRASDNCRRREVFRPRCGMEAGATAKSKAAAAAPQHEQRELPRLPRSKPRTCAPSASLLREVDEELRDESPEPAPPRKSRKRGSPSVSPPPETESFEEHSRAWVPPGVRNIEWIPGGQARVSGQQPCSPKEWGGITISWAMEWESMNKELVPLDTAEDAGRVPPWGTWTPRGPIAYGSRAEFKSGAGALLWQRAFETSLICRAQLLNCGCGPDCGRIHLYDEL